MAKKDENQFSAYDALVQLQASTWQQADKIRTEIEEIDATIADREVKTEEALLLGKDPSGMEDEIQALRSKRANLEKRIQVLESATGSDIFADSARKAIEENTLALKAVNAEWKKAIEKLDEAWRAYLAAVRLFKPLENKSSTLLSRRERCHGYLPRGSEFVWAEGVSEPNIPGQQRGPIFRCLDQAAIKAAYNNS